MSWREVFSSRPNPLIVGLADQAAVMAQVVKVLHQFVTADDPRVREKLARQASEQEHEGDRLRARLVSHLLQSLVTPFDREDINRLSRAVDDIVDYSENTIKEIYLYGIIPDSAIQEMVATLGEAGTAIHEAIQALPANRLLSQQRAQDAKRLENRMEALYRQAIADLSQVDDLQYVIRLREVYRHLSNSADRVDSAANIIVDIVIKEGR